MFMKGKKKFFLSAYFIFMCGVCIAQDIIVDVKNLTASSITTGSADFTKSFTVKFVNNTAGSNTEIKITADAAPELIKKGITAAEKNELKIEFVSSDNGRKLSVKKQDGSMLELNIAGEIQMTYMDKEIIIPKKKTGAADENKAASAGKKDNDIIVGVELHDAILAKKYYDEKDPKLFIMLAKIKNSEETDREKILELYKGNKFIDSLIKEDEFSLFIEKETDKAGAQGGFAGGLISKALNADVTSLADGLARFLVKRTKEELNIAFFERFKELINKEEYKDAQILFPETMETLNAIDEEVYQFENYITSLREAFEKDLTLLLDHLPAVIEEGRFNEYFTSKPNLKYSLLLTLFASRELLNGTHPGKVIATLPDEYLESFKKNDRTTDKNIEGSFKTIQLISESLRSKAGDKYWTSLDSVQLLYKNDKNLVAAKFYLGFLYEKAKEISFESKSLRDYLDAIAAKEDDIKKYISFVKETGKKYHDIESAIRQVKEDKPETTSAEVYNRLFKSFADGFEQALKIETLPGINIDGKLTDDIKKYLKVFRETNDLALNISQKSYGSAVVNAFNIYLTATEKKAEATTKKNESVITRNENLFVQPLAHRVTTANAGSEKTADNNGSDSKQTVSANSSANKTLAFIKKYGSFMANAVKAKNSEEVAAAIESVALPVGSSRIKRNSNWNIALNGYVGMYLGYERIKGVDSSFKANSYGITAPVGISVSKGINWQGKKALSASLFFSVIDLGAPVAFRFKDDKTEQLPTIQLKDIVSPGIFFSLGLPRLPVSVNAGWQAGPVLRKINETIADKASSTYSRWGISIVVDIPLLNFYTNRRDGN